MTGDNASVTEKVMALERAVLDRWYESDSVPYSEKFTTDATYFAPGLPQRIDGPDVQKNLASFTGQIPVQRYEMINPSVDVHGDTAILTFNLVTYETEEGASEVVDRWNATEIYRHTEEGWKTVHAHWSFTQ
ncbi:MAG: YybH family protein [Acidimicrobiia bacterium]